MTIVTRSPTLKDCNDRGIGESPRWRGLRRNCCRVFSMIPFEALTISSPAVVDVEHVELEHLARRAEPFREGRPRPAAVSVDPLLDVGPRLRGHPEFRPVSLHADDLGREQPSSPRGIRAPVNDPPRRALGDRLADQNRERPFKLCFVHGGRHPQEDAVRLRGSVLLQRDDILPGRGLQPIDLGDPRCVDATHGRLQVDLTLPRLLDFHDERSPAAFNASGPVRASSAHRDSSRAAISKSIFDPTRNVSNSQGPSFRATRAARSSYRPVRPAQTQHGPSAITATSRTARPRSWFVRPWPSLPKRRPRQASHRARSPSARQSTERAAARISSTGPEGRKGLKVHASRTTLISRFVRTIPVIKTYARSRSSRNESRLSRTRATGVKISTRTPRFR